MKDHEIAQLVGALTICAREYGHTQQLRERIAGLVVPVLKGAQKEKERLDFLLEKEAYVTGTKIMHHVCEDEFETVFDHWLYDNPRELIDKAIANEGTR